MLDNSYYLSQPIKYLTLHGIPCQSKDSIDPDSVYLYLNGLGKWTLNKNDLTDVIENLCIVIHELIGSKIFANVDDYRSFLSYSPELLYTAGRDSESICSKDDFNKIIQILEPKIPVFKILYMFDCQQLVSGIQQCSNQIMQILGEFYKTLNLEPLFIPEIRDTDGIRYMTSPTVLKLHSYIDFIFIRLHSILDYITKLAIEVENLRTDFSKYPKIFAKNELYGNKNKTKLNNMENTLFHKGVLVNKIESIRNKIIHFGLLDNNIKAYEVIKNKICVEKFIIFPDFSENGQLVSYVNRDLFYSNGSKINLELVDIIFEYNNLLKNTLEQIIFLNK